MESDVEFDVELVAPLDVARGASKLLRLSLPWLQIGRFEGEMYFTLTN